MNKVVFLDIDGVLATRESYGRYKKVEDRRYPTFDKLAVVCMNRLLKESGAKVVVSSAWRKFYTLDQLRKILEKEGVTGAEIVGVTGSQFSSGRGEEIKGYLSENEVDSFVIIDDDSFDIAPVFPDKLVWIEGGIFSGGINDFHVDKALKILGCTK